MKDIVTVKQISEVIKLSENNVRQTYKNNKDKREFYEAIVIGTYVKLNNIDIYKLMKSIEDIKNIIKGIDNEKE